MRIPLAGKGKKVIDPKRKSSPKWPPSRGKKKKGKGRTRGNSGGKNVCFRRGRAIYEKNKKAV